MAEDSITVYQGVGNLADNLGVGETNDKTVLGGLVLVLVLGAKTLTLTVVSLSLAAATELDLVPGEVGFAFLDSDENLELETKVLDSITIEILI